MGLVRPPPCMFLNLDIHVHSTALVCSLHNALTTLGNPEHEATVGSKLSLMLTLALFLLFYTQMLFTCQFLCRSETLWY